MRRWLTAGDGTDALRLTHVPVPTPAPTEVLVRIEALSLNYRDLLVVNGDSTWRPARPVVPISDAAGTVVALGSQVTRFLMGDRVSAMFLPYWRTGPLAADTYHSPTGGPGHAPACWPTTSRWSRGRERRSPGWMPPWPIRVSTRGRGG